MHTIKIWLVTLIITGLTVMFSVACGRGHKSNSFLSELQSVTSDTNITPSKSNSQPTFQPFPAFPEGNYPKSPVRHISDTNFSVQGADYVATVGTMNKINENDQFNYVIISDAQNKIAFAQYNVAGLTPSRPVKMNFSMTKYKPADESEDLPMNYYIGIANYTNYSWEWNGPYTEIDPLNFEIILNSKEKYDRYVDKAGTLHFIVLCSINDAPKTSKFGRVGLGFDMSTTTISPNYYVNNPHYAAIKKIYSGTKTTSSITKDQYVTLEWEHVNAFNADDKKNEAYIYNVYRLIEGESKLTKIGTILAPLTYYEDPPNNFSSDPPIPDPIPGVKMNYYLQSAHANGFTPLSNSRSIVIQIHAPANVKASNGNAKEVSLSWDEVDGAVSYEIWASYTPNDPSIVKIDTISAPKVTGSPVTYSDTTATLGKTRYYRIKALGKEKIQKEGTSDYSSEVSGMMGEALQPPTDVSATDTSAEEKITITWKHPASGPTPDGYDIYESSTENGTYTKLTSVGYVTSYEYKPGDEELHWFMLKSTKDKYEDSKYSNKDVGSVGADVVLSDDGGSELPGTFQMYGKPDDTDVRINWSVTGGKYNDQSLILVSNDQNNSPGYVAGTGAGGTQKDYGILWFLRDPKNMGMTPALIGKTVVNKTSSNGKFTAFTVTNNSIVPGSPNWWVIPPGQWILHGIAYDDIQTDYTTSNAAMWNAGNGAAVDNPNGNMNGIREWGTVANPICVYDGITVYSDVRLIDDGGSELPGSFDMYGKPDDTDVRINWSVTGGRYDELSNTLVSNDKNNSFMFVAGTAGEKDYGLLWFLRDPENMSLTPPLIGKTVVKKTSANGKFTAFTVTKDTLTPGSPNWWVIPPGQWILHGIAYDDIQCDYTTSNPTMWNAGMGAAIDSPNGNLNGIREWGTVANPICVLDGITVYSGVMLIDDGGSELPGTFDMYGKPDDTDVRINWSVTGGCYNDLSVNLVSNDVNNNPGYVAGTAGEKDFGILWFLRDPKNMGLTPPLIGKTVVLKTAAKGKFTAFTVTKDWLVPGSPNWWVIPPGQWLLHGIAYDDIQCDYTTSNPTMWNAGMGAAVDNPNCNFNGIRVWGTVANPITVTATAK